MMMDFTAAMSSDCSALDGGDLAAAVDDEDVLWTLPATMRAGAAPLAPLPRVAVPEPPPNNKKKRGPRFKYVYDCPEAAAEARRARNRATALRSYRQKRQHTADMEAMVSRLEKERGVLLKLLRAVEDGTVAGIGDDRDIDGWVRDNEGGADASVPVPHGASR